MLQNSHSVAYVESTSQNQAAIQKDIFAFGQTELSRYLDIVQDSLKEGWSAHSTKDGRLYYCK